MTLSNNDYTILMSISVVVKICVNFLSFGHVYGFIKDVGVVMFIYILVCNTITINMTPLGSIGCKQQPPETCDTYKAASIITTHTLYS